MAAALLASLLPATGPAWAEEAAPGDLYIQSSPPGAGVLLDGQDTGQRTPTLLRGVAPGPHDLRLEQGCALAVAEVDVRPRVVTRTELDLEPGSGRLEVASSPAGAEVSVDGVLRGQAPLGLAVACGEHQLALALDGFQPWVVPFALGLDEVLTRSVDLTPLARGTLVVVPEPLDAEVWLDGVQVGQGAMTLDPVDAGVHDLLLRARGLSDQRRRVEVPDGDVLRVEVSLVRPPAPVAIPPAVPGEPIAPPIARHEVGRRLLASAVALVGSGLAAHGAWTWSRTAPVYQDYLGMEDHRAADAFYDENVAPARVLIAVDLTAAGLLLTSATGLWFRAPRDWFRHEGRGS
ncbi:MAG: PEGA domain-containing protein [Pseudomonadota bacterium]